MGRVSPRSTVAWCGVQREGTGVPASTTEAANDNRGWDEGLSYCVTSNGEKFQLKEAIDELKGEIIGDDIWNATVACTDADCPNCVRSEDNGKHQPSA